MNRHLAAFAVAAAALAAPPISAQTVADGEALYTRHCLVCHRANGFGYPPGIPALAGSENLEDAYRIVWNIHMGQGYMPPFPGLGPEQIAALATYVRGAWGNGLDPVSTETVNELLEEIGPAEEPEIAARSIWDGVYTRAQAERGQQVTRAACGLCHGSRLNGVPDDNDMTAGPPLARAYFLRVWEGRTLGSLLGYSRWTMPVANPGFLSDEDYAAIIAYQLALTGAPAGATPLPADVRTLGHITIGPKP